MLEIETASRIVGTLADLLATASEAGTGTEAVGSGKRWEEIFAGQIANQFRQQFIPAADGDGFLRFDDEELAKRFGRLHISDQAFFLRCISAALNFKKQDTLHLYLKWSENKNRSLRVRAWSINSENALSFDLL